MKRRAARTVVWGTVKLLFVPLIIISVFMLVWLRSEITSLEYKISQYEKERLNLLSKKKELIVHRSDILSIKNIEYVAKERFGLTFPDRSKVIYVVRDERAYNYRAGLGSHSE